MPRIHTIVWALFLTLSLVGCACNNEKKNSFVEHFPLVNAPSIMSDDQKIDYLATHFWDKYFKMSEEVNSADTSAIGGVLKPEMEQAMANYIALLLSQPLEKAKANAASFAQSLIKVETADSASVVFDRLSEMFEKYIYDPNSPVRDEDIYAGYALEMSSYLDLPMSERASYLEDARLCSLNERGTKAADFSFSDKRGRIYTLYGITAEKIILFFSNPGCTACKDIIETLKMVPGMNEAISSGKIAVLNIYIDEDIKGWWDYMPIYPDEWYNGYDCDHMIRGDELYNVRAIPSLYLLDENKTVLLKDVPVERMINNL